MFCVYPRVCCRPARSAPPLRESPSSTAEEADITDDDDDLFDFDRFGRGAGGSARFSYSNTTKVSCGNADFGAPLPWKHPRSMPVAVITPAHGCDPDR